MDVQSFNPSVGLIDFVLYGAFSLRASIDAQTGAFGLAVLLPGDASVSRLLGKRFSLNNGEASICASLALADEYCRLRLPDKYLDALEANTE